MAKERIFVIDDSPAVRSLAERYLREAGYQVSAAGDPDEGLAEAQRLLPDLILVDQIMPNVDGIALADRIRNASGLQDTPIVLMSSSLDTLEEKIENHGIADSVSKPFDPHALRAVVENTLRRGAARTGRKAPLLPDPGPDASLVRQRHLAEVAEQIAARLVDALASRLPDLKDRTDELERALVDSLNARALAAMAEALRQLDPSGGVAAFGGELSAVPLADVLQMLGLQGQTGELQVASDTTEIAVFFKDGLIDLAQAKGSPKEFLLGRYLVEEGFMTKQDLDLLIKSRSGGRLLGDQLVKLGYLTEDDLRVALGRQTSELLYEVLRWRSGRYLFRPNTTRFEAERARLGLSVPDLLLEGFRRVDEWRIIEQVINNFDMVPAKREGAIDRLAPRSLTPEEYGLLDEIDGHSTIRDIIARSRSGSYQTCKILYQLFSLKLVERLEPLAPALEGLDPEALADLKDLVEVEEVTGTDAEDLDALEDVESEEC